MDVKRKESIAVFLTRGWAAHIYLDVCVRGICVEAAVDLVLAWRDGRRRSGDLHRSMASAKGIERDFALEGRIH